MKISELSQRSGVPVPTIKFYIREGLLPPGERTAKNQASYTETHLSLLSLARTLKDELDMSVPDVARIMAASSLGGVGLLEVGMEAIAKSRAGRREIDRRRPEFALAVDFAKRLFTHVGWQPPGDDPASQDTISALMTLFRVWPEQARLEGVEKYVAAMKELVKYEIPEDFDPETDPLGAFKYAVLGTYLFEPLLLALRRVAHGERSAEVARLRNVAACSPKTARRGAAPRTKKRKGPLNSARPSGSGH